MTNMRDRLKSILASAALIAPLLLVSPASAAFTSRDVLIKGPGTGVAVYYLANDGKRYVFPNQKTYKSWFTSFSGVYTITPEEIASFPIGGNVTYRPGIRLVKIDTDPKVYAVDRGGTLRWIMTESAAAAIYGGDWNTKVDDVPDAFFTNYLLGPDISSASQYSPFAAAASATTINADKGISTSGNATVSDTSPAAPGAPSSPPPPPPPVVPPPSSSCSADVWVCTTWSACDSSGSQTRTCSLTTDCPGTTSATPAQTQACTPIYSGTVSVTAIEEPGDVLENSDAILAKFTFSAGSEDLKLTKVSFNVATPVAVATLTPYDGGAPVTAASPVDGSGNAFFSNMNFVINKNTSKTLTVWGRINPLGPSGASSGANAKVTLKDTSGPYQFEIVGASSGSTTKIVSIPGGERSGGDKIVRRTLPSVSVVALPSTALTLGTVVAARVAIATAAADMSIKTLTFDIQKPNAAQIDVSGDGTHTSVRVHGSGENLLGHSSGSSGCLAGGGTTCKIRVMFEGEEMIAGNSSKTYDLRLMIGGTLTGGDALATSLLGDAIVRSGALTAGSTTDQVRVGGSDVDFAWSDLSAVPHNATVGASSLDWASGTYFPGLPTDVQVLVK